MAALTIINVDINANILTYTFNPQIESFTANIFNTTTNQAIGNSFEIGNATTTINYVSILGAATDSISVGDGLIIVSTGGGGPGQIYTGQTVYIVPAPPANLGSTSVVITTATINTNSISYTSSYSGSFTATVQVVRGGTTYTSTQITVNSPSGTATLINSVGGAQIVIYSGDVIRVYATAGFGGAAVSAPYTAPTPGTTSVVITAANLASTPKTLTATSSFTTPAPVVYLETNGVVNTITTYTITAGPASYSITGLAAGQSVRFKATPAFGGGYISAAFAIPAAVPCVCAGTMISTTAGERAVETLSAGDLILTADGREVAIKSIMTTEIAACSGRNAPYVIQAGAFGRNLPNQPLTVSPGHALMVSPAKWMIPCHTSDPSLRAKMARYANGQQVVYYHVELPNYLQDTFIANGVVSEAYGLNWAKTYKGPSVYTQMSNGYFTRAGGAVARTHKAAMARK